MKDDSHFEYLTFSWTAPNGMEGTYASLQAIFDIIIIIMVNFQVDKFFDITVHMYGIPALKSLRLIIKSIFMKSRPVEKVPGKTILHSTPTAEKGIIGFVPNVSPDPDDTAKAITVLQYIGKFPLDILLKMFELLTHL